MNIKNLRGDLVLLLNSYNLTNLVVISENDYTKKSILIFANMQLVKCFNYYPNKNGYLDIGFTFEKIQSFLKAIK